ncbi:hypothetical protein M2132_000359 [Dysgonomonas sp. PH5-45]|uniref:type I restriction enzyme HsdR N-terminal domain-containing protein n=1 Tax=unclassified Dysgonomonas TaxID=2630389 RepID=UPI0024759FFF|nr:MULTISPECIES: type I restriction enzyme HsdR N-terminal domain-containing protein [unclassified Dysgonomonas]MDH6354039.1 hypothetical protein [Dysgonomonas sp. PH5-45]MDH6386941.1 hypothetical protein [Dysgonomonas sp. PH5-37]
MLALNLPPFNIKLKKANGKIMVWDGLRGKYVVLTPEEWVRQHFVNYLVHEKGYPPALMANEVQIELNNLKKRCDTIIYNRNLTPLAVVEYKAPDVKVSQETFDQIIRYNMALKVGYLIVSNGLEHYCCCIDYQKQTFSFMEDIPHYGCLHQL